VPVLKKVIPVTSHAAVPAVVPPERVHDAIDGTTFDPSEMSPVGVVGEADVSVTVIVQVVSCPITMVDKAQETLVVVESRLATMIASVLELMSCVGSPS